MILNIQTLWQNFLAIINNKVNPISFNTWFKDASLLEIENGKAIIQVPMILQKNLLMKNYYDLIEETFQSLTGENYDIDFVLEDEMKNEPIESIINDNTNKKNIVNTNLNNKYTFQNFIVGESNKFAQTAGLSVAQNPGELYNPLFIYGKSGVGKTHLMHAIGNYIKENSNLNVLYVTSDEFTTDFTGIRNVTGNNQNYVEYFKDKYRNVDVLIIDDIQFLAGAEKTQQEFFNTFNYLYSANKQIIISSDRSPDDLKLLEDRLRTRFAWGLPVDILPPDIILKKQILKNKINGHDVAKKIDDDVIEFIANSCENDVRHLEGAITRLYAYTAIMGFQHITLEIAMEALKDYTNKNIYITNNISKIQKSVADYYNITINDLKSKKRTSNINYPRQIAMYMCRMLTEESLIKIGLEFGGRDHATVIHAVDKISNDIKSNKKLNEIISNIKDML